MRTRTKLWIVLVAALLLVVGGLVAVKAAQIGKMMQAGKSFVPPPETVASAQVTASKWQGSRAAIATVVAVRGVTVGAELAGVVREIGFESGAAVRKGALLVKLDTSTEEAQLAAARADASLAKVNLKRARHLREAGSNSPAELEAAEAREKQADAAVAALEATIAKKTIRAPFDGRLAIRQVELGQLVSPGTSIASLHQESPVYAEFTLPQQALAEVRAGDRVSLRTDAYPDATWEGVVTTVNPEVDAATRNVRMRATIENRDGRLRPGMFGNVEVLSGGARQVLLVPATAPVYAPYGDSVYAIEKKEEGGKTALVARQKFVRLGERRGDFVEAVSGLAAGETVVASGAFKLRNGMGVVVNDKLAPDAKLDPKPTDR